MEENILFSLGRNVLEYGQETLHGRLVNGLIFALQKGTGLEIDLVGVSEEALQMLAEVLLTIRKNWPEDKYGELDSLIAFTIDSPNRSIQRVLDPTSFSSLHSEKDYEELRSLLSV